VLEQSGRCVVAGSVANFAWPLMAESANSFNVNVGKVNYFCNCRPSKMAFVFICRQRSGHLHLFSAES
jgi:hypothetical protein